MRYPKAEASPFLTLGSEKWLEDPLPMVSGDSAAAVSEGYAKAMACRFLTPIPRLADSQSEATTSGDGLHGIHE